MVGLGSLVGFLLLQLVSAPSVPQNNFFDYCAKVDHYDGFNGVKHVNESDELVFTLKFSEKIGSSGHGIFAYKFGENGSIVRNNLREAHVVISSSKIKVSRLGSLDGFRLYLDLSCEFPIGSKNMMDEIIFLSEIRVVGHKNDVTSTTKPGVGNRTTGVPSVQHGNAVDVSGSNCSTLNSSACNSSILKNDTPSRVRRYLREKFESLKEYFANFLSFITNHEASNTTQVVVEKQVNDKYHFRNFPTLSRGRDLNRTTNGSGAGLASRPSVPRNVELEELPSDLRHRYLPDHKMGNDTSQPVRPPRH